MPVDGKFRMLGEHRPSTFAAKPSPVCLPPPKARSGHGLKSLRNVCLEKMVQAYTPDALFAMLVSPDVPQHLRGALGLKASGRNAPRDRAHVRAQAHFDREFIAHIDAYLQAHNTPMNAASAPYATPRLLAQTRVRLGVRLRADTLWLQAYAHAEQASMGRCEDAWLASIANRAERRVHTMWLRYGW